MKPAKTRTKKAAPRRKKASPRAAAIEGLRKLVLKAVRDASGNADLEFDADGGLALRFGSAVVFVRVLDAPLCVRTFSPMLEGVEAGDRLVGRLNALNAEIRFARFFAVQGKVIVTAETYAAPFVAEHVAQACLQVGGLADQLGGALQKELGGRRPFAEGPEEAKVQ